jgi:hypothetical protein
LIQQQQQQQQRQQYQQQEDGSDYERLQASNWVIDWSQLNTDLNNRRKVIGQGSYGRVTIGCYNQTGGRGSGGSNVWPYAPIKSHHHQSNHQSNSHVKSMRGFLC